MLCKFGKCVQAPKKHKVLKYDLNITIDLYGIRTQINF
jgi:hypothetical protein